MSKEDDVTGAASEEQINQAYKESYDPPDPNTLEKELQKQKRNKKTPTDTEGNTLTNSPGQVFKGGEQITGTTPPDTDMRTGEMIPNDTEEDEFGNPKFAESIAFETGLNIALDKLTTPLLGAPIPFARVAYGISNAGLSAIINYYAQRIRGTKFSLGELITASGLSLVPGGVNAKTLQGSIAKAARKGAGTGAIAVTSESLIDTGDFPDVGTFAAGTLFGGVAGGTFQATSDFVEDIPAILKGLRQRANGDTGTFDSRIFQGVGTVGAAKVNPKGSGDPEGLRSLKYQEGDILANTPTKNVKLLKDLNLTDDQSVFLLSNYYKEGSVTSTTISRDQAAAIESLYTTVEEFDKTKDLALPYFLKGMKGIKRDKTPQLDHIAQLKAALPFFNNAKVAQFPEITKIILEEGVFGLGHQRGNFKYLEFDVHTVKSNYFEDIVGNNGEIFFKNRDISTPQKLRAAAKEFAAIINTSNNVVADAIEQYKFMNKIDISETELDEFVNILSKQPIRRKYSIKQVKDIFKQMEEDGFIQTPKESLKAEQAEVRSEIKEAQAKAKQQERLDKDASSVQRRVEQLSSAPIDKFTNPFALNMKDETLRELAEKAYKETQEYKLTLGPQQLKLDIFETENREAWIKRYMRRTLDKIKRDLKKKK